MLANRLSRNAVLFDGLDQFVVCAVKDLPPIFFLPRVVQVYLADFPPPRLGNSVGHENLRTTGQKVNRNTGGRLFVYLFFQSLRSQP